MFKNIKLIGVIFLSVLLLTNCKKDSKDDSQSPGELVFAAIDYDDSEKDGFDFFCDENLVVNHAYIVLEDQYGVLSTHEPLTFTLDNKLYTQSIKLEPGPYIIKEFALMTEDNQVVKATPMLGADFDEYVSNPIDDVVDFTIIAFEKAEYAIDVLCYIPAEWDNFGFEWFEVTEITLREQCFFGDICIYDFDAYAGSLYDNPLVNDEVAIFKIIVYRDRDVNTEPVGIFYNTYWVGNDLMYRSPLCVQYADYDLDVNNFEFELWILTNNGYEYFYTWYFADAERIPSNNQDAVPGYDDGVVDFVLGDCVVTPSDLVLLP